MYRLAAGAISVDGSVVVDFYLASEIALLEELFRGRLLMSDFVELELLEADIRLAAAQTAAFSLTEEWNFFADLRRRKPGLGLGELGALTVARFHNAILVTNDRQARSAAEEFEIPVPGAACWPQPKLWHHQEGEQPISFQLLTDSATENLRGRRRKWTLVVRRARRPRIRDRGVSSVRRGSRENLGGDDPAGCLDFCIVSGDLPKQSLRCGLNRRESPMVSVM